MLSKHIVKRILRCDDCRRKPAVFIQTESGRIGVCWRHWRKIAFSNS